jgi:hypothetical protein
MNQKVGLQKAIKAYFHVHKVLDYNKKSKNLNYYNLIYEAPTKFKHKNCLLNRFLIRLLNHC